MNKQELKNELQTELRWINEAIAVKENPNINIDALRYKCPKKYQKYVSKDYLHSIQIEELEQHRSRIREDIYTLNK